MTNMTFASSASLWLILIVLLMAACVVWLLRWRKRARESFAGPQASVWPSSPFALRLLLVLIAATLIVVAAARPQWGNSRQQRQSQGVELVIALDVSQSMQGTDVQPTRLAAAQTEIKRLLAAQRGSRIGLVFFAGTAVTRSPLSSDIGALSELIDRAGRELTLTRAGSDLASALQLADALLVGGESNAGKAVIIVSDGEDHAPSYDAKLRELRDKGVGVYTVGAGTARGSQLFDLDARGQPRLKLDAGGRPVITRLDELRLRTIAETGGGRYLQLDGSGGSMLSLSDDLARLDQAAFGIQTDTLPVERYQPFVIAALILLVEAWLLPSSLLAPAANKLRRLRPHPGLALALLALFIGACSGGDPLRSQNQSANRLYASGDFDGALKAYEAMLAQRPDVPQLGYNAGNTLHRLASYDRAIAESQRALPPSETKLGAHTYYSLGNHYLALQRYEEAYDSYKSALLLDPKDQDAKYNLELTLRLFYAGMQPGQQPQPGGIPAPGQGQPPPDGQQPGQAPGQGAPGQQGPPGQQGQPSPNSQPGQPPPGAPGGPGGQQPEGPSTSPPPPDAPSGGDAQRSLQDALRGLDQEVSFEDAIRLLDLLRDQPVPRGTPGGAPTGPDY